MAVYICSKPLQVMVALILAKAGEDSLYLVDWFSDVDRISVNAELNDRFVDVKVFRSRARAMLQALKERFAEVYIDSDIGLKSYVCITFLRAFGCKQVGVYEEGVGTYRIDIISGWRKFLYSAIGASCYFGQSHLVGKVVVFDDIRYQKLFPYSAQKVTKIPVSLQAWCEVNLKMLKEIFAPDFDFKVSKCSSIKIYLTDWSVGLSLVSVLSEKGELYIKPHPHIRENSIYIYKEQFPSVKWIPSSLPAEVVFIMALRNYEYVHVYHYGSSAIHYFSSVNLTSTLLVR